MAGTGAVTQVFSLLLRDMGSQARPAHWLTQFGGITQGGDPALAAGPPELVLGIAEALGHEVHGLVGLVLVRLHGHSFRVKGPDLGLLGQAVLAGGRGGGHGVTGPPAPRAPQELQGGHLTPRWPWVRTAPLGASGGLGTVWVGWGPLVGTPADRQPLAPASWEAVLCVGPSPAGGMPGVSPGALRRRTAALPRRPSALHPACTVRTPP